MTMKQQLEPEAEWNLLIYMAADNNLGEIAERTLAEIRRASNLQGIRLLVQKDTEKKGTERFAFSAQNGGKAEKLGAKNMGDPATLTEFLKYAGSYPSKRTALVIWNHGGGTLGLDVNAKANGNRKSKVDFLTNQEFKNALSNAEEDGGRKLDLIACDACLTGTLELANEIRDHADYYVAPETNTPSKGWPYVRILEQLKRNPTMPSDELAQLIVESVARTPPRETTAVVGAWRLQDIAALTTAIDDLAPALQAIDRDTLAEIREAMILMEDPDYVDLESFISQFEAHLTKLEPANRHRLEPKIGVCRERLQQSSIGLGPERGLSGMSILFPSQSSYWVTSRLARIPQLVKGPPPPPTEDLLKPLVAGLRGAKRWNRFLVTLLTGRRTRSTGNVRQPAGLRSVPAAGPSAKAARGSAGTASAVGRLRGKAAARRRRPPRT
jgi:hypothetical protein